MDATKDITIGDRTYQLVRLGAREGSWIVGQFLTKGLLIPLDQGDAKPLDEKELGVVFAITLRDLPENIFNSVMQKCLATVRRYETVAGVPMPVLMSDGRWAIKPEPDLVELTALIVASLVFNLHCFFAPGALQKLLTVFPGSQQAPGSTATSSDQ